MHPTGEGSHPPQLRTKSTNSKLLSILTFSKQSVYLRQLTGPLWASSLHLTSLPEIIMLRCPLLDPSNKSLVQLLPSGIFRN